MKNLLLVDDEQELVEPLADILEMEGKFNKIFTANNGKEALDVLKKNKINVLVSDIDMPIMNGIDLIKEIKTNSNQHKLLNIPEKIFYLTGNIKNKELIEEKYITDILFKPIQNYEKFSKILLD